MGHVSDPSRFLSYDWLMPRRLFLFDAPDRFLAGAVGPPGDRRFFLEATQGDAVVTVGLEKVQVAALTARLTDLLDALDVPAEVPLPSDVDVGQQRTTEAFRVGAMAIAWDRERSAVVVEAQPFDDGEDYHEADDDDPNGPDLMRVRLRPGPARAFVRQADALVAAGRPPCPFCGQPLEATGHFCPRASAQLN